MGVSTPPSGGALAEGAADLQREGRGRRSGQLESRQNRGRSGVALIDWISLCDTLEHAADRALAEDVRQLRGFVQQVDEDSFLQLTLEQLTDRESARRHVELVKLIHSIRAAGARDGRLPKGRKGNANTGWANGITIRPGGVWTAFRVDPYLQARHGQSRM